MIKGLHHNACRCRDSEEMRAFYEDFLGFLWSMRLRFQRQKQAVPPKLFTAFIK